MNCPHCLVPVESDERIEHVPTTFVGKLCVCGHPEHRHSPGRKSSCWAIEDNCKCTRFSSETG